MAEVPWVVRFVSSPDAARTTRLDLNDEPTGGDMFVNREGFSLGTADLLTAMVESMLDDTGGRVVARRRVDRELTVPVVVKGTMPTFATAVGALAREADRKSNWLEFRPGEHTGESVFFELLQGDIGDVDIDPEDQDPDDASVERPVTLTLLCKPTAVGLPQTGSFTTGPDPAGSNKPFGMLPATKGDVPAPLTVEVGPASTDPSGPIMVNVCSGPLTFAAPYFVQAETLNLGTGATLPGADTAMSGTGSSYARIGFGTNNLTTLRLSGNIASVPPGRWRVWGRLRNTVAADTFELRVDVGTATSAATGEVRTFEPSAAANSTYWVDLGTLEHPYYAPPDVTAAENLTLRLYAQRTTGTGSLDVDLLMLTPRDLRGNDPGRSALVYPTDTLTTGDRWVLRPDLEMAHPSVPARPAPIIGSHDFRAVPGENTYIHLLRRTYPGTTQLTGTNIVQWSYRPRWQYLSEPA